MYNDYKPHRIHHEEVYRQNQAGLQEDSTNTFPYLNFDEHNIDIQETGGNNRVNPQIGNRPGLQNQSQFACPGINITHNQERSANNHRSAFINSLDRELEKYMDDRGRHNTKISTPIAGSKSPIRFPTPEPISLHTGHQRRSHEICPPNPDIQQWRTSDNLDQKPLIRKDQTTVANIFRKHQQKHIAINDTSKQYGRDNHSSLNNTTRDRSPIRFPY
jgi:hypothetical protein